MLCDPSGGELSGNVSNGTVCFDTHTAHELSVNIHNDHFAGATRAALRRDLPDR
jgi:hypothetical protein